ncbi:hypothetical protein [Mucilaginibacter sp. SG564]|uniref:hypothetical protein n=1 Tax=Mucilaginibacter sp. SG564 TaxID=2587022 RepID=UPI0015531173|nr:hypothetical protein [Mucilaginibacter sp. SG564]NOW98945.1 hypothetical protein [Mucilaginibacter sp. SG564]
MSNFWTEDTITTVQRTFIKGTFTGKYYAEHRGEWSQTHSEFYHMHIYQAEVRLEEVRKDEEGDFPEVTGMRSFKGTFGQPISCYDPGSGAYFQLNLEEPRIADPVLSKVMKEDNEHLGTISGTIYGYISKILTERVRTEHVLPDPPPFSAPAPPVTAAASTGTGGKAWTRTANFEYSYIHGSRHRRDYYRHGNGAYRWGDWYAVETGWSFTTLIKTVLGICFIGLLLLWLINWSWPGLFVLGLILLAAITSRVGRTGWGNTFRSIFYGLLCLLYLAGIAISIFRVFQARHPGVPRPDQRTDRRDFTRTQPVRHRAVRKEMQKEDDEWIIHHRAWTDQDGHPYEGDVRVLRSAYRRAVAEHEGLKDVRSLSDVYTAMTLADRSRLNGVYPLFDSLRRVNRLDSLQFAQMLVGFVQDIPYTTVTEGSCGNSAADLNLSGPEGRVKACLGHIPYGVQSPVEFMANLEGDCDTRTLFLFTLFNHYRYRVAILGSTAFRHSLLGLELPLPGSAKMAGPQRFVLWETTAKGFTAGRLSPEVDHMDYWDFYLINTLSS